VHWTFCNLNLFMAWPSHREDFGFSTSDLLLQPFSLCFFWRFSFHGRGGYRPLRESSAAICLRQTAIFRQLLKISAGLKTGNKKEPSAKDGS
jgi:hypothetical protein